MQSSNFQIDAVDTGIFGLDGGSMFGTVPKTLWSKIYNPGDELNRIPLAARPMLVRWDGKNLLVDTGNGNKWNEKLASIYNIDVRKSSVEKALSPFGLSPGDIDYVILTHLHFDHAGGATSKGENGEIAPTFPNARYFVQKEQLEWARKSNTKEKPSFLTENFEPLIAEGVLETIDGSGELFPGFEVIPSFGHTFALQMVKVSTGSHTFIYVSDLSPTAAHIPPNYYMGYDNNALVVIEEKKKLISEAYEDGWIVVFEHDAFLQASTVISTERGFRNGEPITLTTF